LNTIPGSNWERTCPPVLGLERTRVGESAITVAYAPTARRVQPAAHSAGVVGGANVAVGGGCFVAVGVLGFVAVAEGDSVLVGKDVDVGTGVVFVTVANGSTFGEQAARKVVRKTAV